MNADKTFLPRTYKNKLAYSERVRAVNPAALNEVQAAGSAETKHFACTCLSQFMLK